MRRRILAGLVLAAISANARHRPSTTKDSNVVAHCDTSAIDANTIWDRSANVRNSPVSTADRVTNIPPATEHLASVRPISRDLCAKTQWIP